MPYQRQKPDLSASTVWAAVVVICALLCFFGFLIYVGRTAELQRMLVLLGQGALSVINIWFVYRGTQTIARRSDENREIAESVNVKVEEIKQTVNGNTPQPGTIPKVEP